MTTQSQSEWPRPFRFTRAQYHEIRSRGFFDGKRVELVFGRILELLPHAELPVVRGQVVEQLESAFAGVAWVGCGLPVNFKHSEPRPDVAVFVGNFESADGPETVRLVVEVADTTLADDLTTKAELYATAGIADYWVLDVENRQLHVFRDPQPLPTGLGATAYRTHLTLGPMDRVSPLAAPAASVLVSDLLP